MEQFDQLRYWLQQVDWISLMWYILIVTVSIQAIYYIFIYSRIAFYSEPVVPVDSQPVSVVVCARNEIKNLKANLPKILEQDHPNFELVVVNDSSFDGTKDYLDELALSDSRVKPVHLDIDERYQKGKKFALTIGIKAAEHEQLLLTDADCSPVSKNWIREMSSGFEQDKNLVIGTSFYQFSYWPINFITRIETFHTAMQYINFAIAKMPYMGVGRNLAYSQALFFDNKGFANHQHLISGDDDLFVNETASKKNISVKFSPDSQTASGSKTKLASYWKQKRRHYSSSKKYKAKHKILLFLPSFSLLLNLLAATVLLIDQSLLLETLYVLGAKLLIQWIVVGINLSKFGKIKNIWTVPLWDPIMVIIYLFVGIQGIFSKPQTWK